MAEDQARELMTRLLGASRPIDLLPLEFGWTAHREPSAEDRSQGRHVGQGSYIIDQNGVMTVQSSLPIPLVVEKYTHARRKGRITGRQVWPEPNVLTFGYVLMFEPGYEDENPIGQTEAPLNLIVVARSTGPTMAVVWDDETQEWTFQPGVAAAVLYANPERHRTSRVERATAEHEVMRFATKPLPTEEELTTICRSARPG